MPAKDIYHNAVKNALIQEGWIITNDPLHLKWGQKDMYVDLGAKQLLAAEQGTRKQNFRIFCFPPSKRTTKCNYRKCSRNYPNIKYKI